MKKIIQNIIIIICLYSFVFFTYKIYNYKKEEKEQKNLNDNLIDIAIKSEETNDENDIYKNKLPIIVDFEALKNENTDIVGWIYSEGTNINYPIVQAQNNDYYLRRLLDGSYNQAGTIFMDCKNSNDFCDYNTIIYGHNMKNDTMFGTLTNYKEQEYFNEHKEMFLFTENKNYKIELFAGFITSSESDIYKFPKNNNSNKKLIKNAIDKSTFRSEVEVNEQDKIITLSTCSYDFENARYVVLGILKEI